MVMTVEVRVNGKVIGELELENIGPGAVGSPPFDGRMFGDVQAHGYKVTATRPGGVCTRVEVAHYQQDGAGRLLSLALGKLPWNWWLDDDRGLPPADIPADVLPGASPNLTLVWNAAKDGEWHTTASLAARTGIIEQSVAARLRELRHPKFGYRVERDQTGPHQFRYRITKEP